MSWLNEDGLYIRYGTEEAEVAKSGQYRGVGPAEIVELKLTGTDLVDDAVIVDRVTRLPDNVQIEKIEVVVDTAFTSGGSAVLDIGVIDTDEVSNPDDDALVAALALSALNVQGETTEITNGGTGAGALVGTKTTKNTYITASYDTAAFTAGVALVRLYLRAVA